MGAIAGIFGISKGSRQKMEFAMKKRGPAGTEQISFKEAEFFHSLKKPEDKGLYLFHSDSCILTFSGRLCNQEALKNLLERGTPIPGAGGLLAAAYEKWGENCLSMLEGSFSFAIWDKKKQRLFFARDPLGIKPLFYRVTASSFIFASEIKEILAVPGVTPFLDAQGAMELVMLGPGRMPGSGILSGIQELEPGCFGILEQGRLEIHRFWKLRDGPHLDSLDQTAETVRALLKHSLQRETAEYPNCGALLSGGLDSSILCALAREENPAGELRTFSVDYVNNRCNFQPGKFQPESDESYIGVMAEALSSQHRSWELTPEDLLDHLQEAMEARDLPGMGDVDSSLLVFSKKVREYVPAVLSGECADELFGGYPWFRDPSIRNSAGFPWAQNTPFRKKLLAEPFPDAEDFVNDVYRDTCRQADILPCCRGEDRRIKELTCLNIRWFMQTLMERNDRMSHAAGLTILTPFCDPELAQYLYRIPWKIKDYEGREKGLLRYAVKGLLPESVRLRKKSPYPKTFDPRYRKMMEGKVRDLLLLDAPIWYLISRQTVLSVLENGMDAPFYGQLMKLPQFCAWILQTEMWLEHYKIEFSF